MNASTDQSKEIQPKEINKKWGVVGIGLLLFTMMLPSIFLLVKIAIGIALISLGTIAVKIAAKTISTAIEDGQSAPQATQSRITNLMIGLTSIFVGGLSLIIIAKMGLIPACAAVTTLALYEYVKDEEIGKNVNNRLDEIADISTKFIISKIEKFLPSQNQETDASTPQNHEADVSRPQSREGDTSWVKV